ncbi:MAG: FecR domain-containing protein [Proteobacteria bacterium]|nr:FecR domain-containing protein [Pseudomonadota bacterium]
MTRIPGTMANARKSALKRALTPGTLFLAFTSFATMLSSTASADVIGHVILQDYRGATATPDGLPDSKEIHYQDQVSALDTVATGEGGATQMQFLDETRFDVGPNAMVKLDDFVFDPTSTEGAGKISMAVGAFRYVGGKMKSDENVKLVTPTATMTIRGTELVIYVGIDGTTEVNVVSGAVDVAPCNKPDAVPAVAGQRVIVPVSCTASVTVARVVPEDLAALDVPDDLGEFSTAAGGNDDGGGSGEGGPGGGGDNDRGGRANDKDHDPKDPPAADPGPSADPEPDPDTGGSGDSPGDPTEGGEDGGVLN